MSFVEAMYNNGLIKITDLESVDLDSETSSSDEDATIKVGVNGSDVYTTKGFGNRLVSFYTMLNRGMNPHEIQRNMRELVGADKATLVDLLVLIFQTRDIRGGKGERDLFYTMMTFFLNTFPEHSSSILKLIPEFGYWQDLWKLYETVMPCVQESIDTLVKEQFAADSKLDKPSLLAKWLPREDSKFDSLARHFAELLFPEVSKEDDMHLRAYRKTVSDLNRKLDTTEIKMCGKSWSTIQPKNVPGRLLRKNKKAFLNEKKKDEEIRYPDDEDRNACRGHFLTYISDLKSGKEVAKGADVLMPHELVQECYQIFVSSKEADDLLQAQWESIRNATKAGGGLEKCVFMCDFSGSMSGTPIMVSLALGILGSELAESAFANHILTFDSEPIWYSFKGCKTLREKVNTIRNIGQGLSTDFQKACDLILKRLVEHKVPKEEAPTNLIVLTDMGFDQASTAQGYAYVKKTEPWQTQFSMIHKSFEEHGYHPPRIVCWNLRDEYKDFHSQADEEGVVNLSGWSASAFKVLQTSGVDALTPVAMLRKILDAPRYDSVRKLAETIFRT